MKDKDNKDITYVLNRKGIKLISIATGSLVLAVLIFAFIKHKRFTDTRILSDYFFTLGIALLILGALTRTFAWIVHKRYILKPRGESESDVTKAKIVLKILSKAISIIGAVNIILSLIFAGLYYYI